MLTNVLVELIHMLSTTLYSVTFTVFPQIKAGTYILYDIPNTTIYSTKIPCVGTSPLLRPGLFPIDCLISRHINLFV